MPWPASRDCHPTAVRRVAGASAVVGSLLLLLAVLAPSASAVVYVPISGAGSTWVQNALDQWRRNVTQYGMQVNFQGTGSSDGRNQFRNGTVDFAASEIPYGQTDNGVYDPPPTRSFAYMPDVAGGTSFMYHLDIAGHRVTNLRLSGETITKIFTGVVTMWNDPVIKKDNPLLALPARRIVPVVRSDGSGTTAQFTRFMSKQYAQLWDSYCAKAGYHTPCGLTSEYPTVPGKGFVALSGSLGVAGYVAQSQAEGAITYVEYSYALNTGFPVAKVLNAAGYYTEPTAQNVAVALLKAQIDDDPSSKAYLTQNLDGVYTDRDPRSYPLSSYSYMIIPTKVEDKFTEDKGRTLGAFAYYYLCEGQQQAPVLGYSPLPINLVRAGLDQVKRIPGVDVQSIDISRCHNPTFSADGTNTLAKAAPEPPACDRAGSTQCTTGTGGARRTSTPVSAGTPNGTGDSGGGGANPGSSGSSATSGGGNGGKNGAGTAAASTAAGVIGDPSAPAATTDAGLAAAAATPVTLPDAQAPSRRGLMLAAVLLLLGLTVGPPLFARRLQRSGRAADALTGGNER